MLARSLYFLVMAIALSACSPRVSTGEVQAAKLDILLEQAGKRPRTVRTSAEICRLWCDPNNPDYRCFFAGRMKDGRDQELRELISRLLQAQPVALPHLELMKIFHLNDPTYEDARGATLVDKNVLINKGSPSILTAETENGVRVQVDVPKEIVYTFAKDTTGFVLTGTDFNRHFYLDLSDPVLQRTYGGSVSSIDVQKDRVIFAAPAGCISYDPAPQLGRGKVVAEFGLILARRLEAERLAGASEGRMTRVRNAYMRATLLKDSACQPDKCPDSCPVNQVPCKFQDGTIACATYKDCFDWGGGSYCGTTRMRGMHGPAGIGK